MRSEYEANEALYQGFKAPSTGFAAPAKARAHKPLNKSFWAVLVSLF